MSASPPIRSIVVGFDGSPSSSRAVALALELARPASAHLYLVHVRERYIEQVEPTTEEESTSAEEAIASAVAAWAERARVAGIPFTAVLRERPTGAAILAVVHEVRPEIVVVGTRGLRPLSKAFLGSVSSELVAHAGRPVLVVP